MVGIVEAFEYLRWTRRYFLCGSFELRAIANENNVALLQSGNLLWKNDDEEVGIIELTEMTMHEQEYITVSGRFATGFLARRIIWDTEILRGDLSTAVGQLLTKHLISPSDSTRKIAGITFNPINLAKPVNTQMSYRNLMDAVTGLCEASDIGIKTVFSPTTGTLEVVLNLRPCSLKSMKTSLNKSTP